MMFFVILTLFIIAFSGKSLEQYYSIFTYVNWFTEPLIYLLFLSSVFIVRRKLRLPFLYLILYFLLIGTASTVINNRFNLDVFFGLRLVLRFYVFFLAIVNLKIQDNRIKSLNKFLAFMFVAQIPVAVIKFSLYGQGEQAIGTYAVHGGFLSTIIPLVALGFLWGFYFYFKKSRMYILGMFGFIAFSVIGGKRAFIFYLPLLFCFMILMLWRDKGFDIRQLRKIRRLSLLYGIMLFLISGVVALKFIPTLNPERKVGGSLDVGYAINYAENYTTRMKPSDPKYTGGRIATTKLVFSTLAKKGVPTLFFGYGPGTRTGSRFISGKSESRAYEDLRIGYGITGMSYIAIEYGILGVVTYFIFMVCLLVRCVQYWKNERDPYWKAFCFGSMVFCFSMITVWGTYSLASVTGDLAPLIFYYCVGIVFNRKKNVMLANPV